MPDPLGLISAGQSFQPHPARTTSPAAPADGPSFKDALMDQIRQVNELQVHADQALDQFATGQRDDIENVMLATQEADTAFRMLLQVRNKVMEAYEEVKQSRV